MAQIIWNTIFITFDIQPPLSISNMFGSCHKGCSSELRIQILVGTTALCWATRLNRNYVVFDRATSNSDMTQGLLDQKVGRGREKCFEDGLQKN